MRPRGNILLRVRVDIYCRFSVMTGMDLNLSSILDSLPSRFVTQQILGSQLAFQAGCHQSSGRGLAPRKMDVVLPETAEGAPKMP